MKLFSALILAALAAFASAQDITFDPATGNFICPTASGVYCSGDSLGTDIIVRCTNFVGQPGRCGNNLVGQPPLGANPARCYASATLDAVAACEKNCIVYGSSGNTGADFSLPGCVPYFALSTSATLSSSTAAPSSSSSSVSSSIMSSTVSSTSVSEPTSSTSTSAPSVSSSTISASNPVDTGYGPGPAPSSSSSSASVPTVAPLAYTPPSYDQPSYNTTLTRPVTTVTYAPPPIPTTATLPDSTITYILPAITTTVILPETTVIYAPPIVPTTATLPDVTITYIPLPIPTTVTFPDTTYTYGPQPSVTVTEATTNGGGVTGTTIASTPSAGVPSGGGGGGSGSSGNGTYTVPTPTTSQTELATNVPTGPSTSPALPSYTGAAASNAAGFGLAVLGLAAAFVL